MMKKYMNLYLDFHRREFLISSKNILYCLKKMNNILTTTYKIIHKILQVKNIPLWTKVILMVMGEDIFLEINLICLVIFRYQHTLELWDKSIHQWLISATHHIFP